ncbi:Transcriptional regulator SlyA [compost metagenome]|uniref:MarR family transcriptional regulator n=1 Tax=Paenibacillus rhizolycopersici TaxID=2780073 RepID=A0ABS2H836_9BACL|nr:MULTISPECIES: MarR family transcriptional regulator [Paenibacillus]MBM6996961.1 MarR family transcriptional regulator [Paenibacillus rhizolycopersici]MUG88463.1 MarR family transcriptional regulator [Paenibacillus timonensis]GIP46461.1 transcriptional regulator [Paenibacillus sp. J53TS2]
MTTDQSQSELAVGFIMGVSYRKIVALLQHRLKGYDITAEQWSVLNQIDRANGLIQKEIADRTGKDKPTTTRIIDLLESKGLVFKEPGRQDRRSFFVYSTERGKEIIRETAPIEQSVTDEVKRMMSGEEYELLMDLLQRIHVHFSDSQFDEVEK